MSFSEIGSVSENQNTKSLPQLETELSSINTERAELKSNINNQWPDIPEPAISYLANSCPAQEVMPSAISGVKN